MSADRYEIIDDGTSIIIAESNGIRSSIDPVDGQHLDDIVICAIRQQSADIAELRAELNRERETNAVLRRDLAEPPPDIQELALKKCGHFEIVAKLRADLAAAVAERDEARTAYQVRNNGWHQHELIALALAERYKLRAEKAEARLAAIEAAPVVAVVHEINRDFASGPYRCLGYDSDKLPAGGNELIARPAKD